MSFLSKLFAGIKALGDGLAQEDTGGDLAQEKLLLSHTAIAQFLEGKISGGEMVDILTAGFIIIPLAEEPEREGANIKSWNPAKALNADGSKSIVIFTSSEAHLAFTEQNNYPYALTTGTDWILSVLPPECGLLFNPDTAHQLDWGAEGIRKFKSDLTDDQGENNIEFEPTNRLEVYLKMRQAGEISEEELLSVLVTSGLYVPSITAVGQNLSGFAPLLCYRDGRPFAAVFTSLELMNRYKDRIKDSISMKGEEMLSRVVPRFNDIVINPGYRIGMELSRRYEVKEYGRKTTFRDFIKNNE